jgi:predicted RNA-binding Zn-ribbon protein involved in translation (DUF1610 family)
MSIVQTVKELFGGREKTNHGAVFTCNACSNVFTKRDREFDDSAEVSCANCGSDDVVRAAST